VLTPVSKTFFNDQEESLKTNPLETDASQQEQDNGHFTIQTVFFPPLSTTTSRLSLPGTCSSGCSIQNWNLPFCTRVYSIAAVPVPKRTCRNYRASERTNASRTGENNSAHCCDNSVCLFQIWGHLGQHIHSQEEVLSTDLPLNQSDSETNLSGSK